MNGYLTYLIEVSIGLGLSLAVYRWLLSDLTFFAWNRAFLLFSLLISLTIPLLSFDFQGFAPVVSEYALPEFQVGQLDSADSDQFLSLSQVLLSIYLLGALGVGFHLLFGFLKAWKMIKKSRQQSLQEITLAVNPEFTPASFFNYILMPEHHPEDDKYRQILLHESMHVRYRHTWDLMIINLCKVFLWFNPLIYLLEKYLREVHEFQADQGVTQEFSPKSYAGLLLNLVSTSPAVQLVNNFDGFQIKKRIVMMAKQPSAKLARMRFICVFPVLMGLVFVFGIENNSVSAENQGNEVWQEMLTKSTEVNAEEPKMEANEVFDVVEEQPYPPGGIEGWNAYLANNLVYPATARERGIEGTVIVVFEIHEDGSVHQPEILRGIGGGADQEAIRVVQNSPRWEPGKQRGRIVKTRMRLPIRFKITN